MSNVSVWVQFSRGKLCLLLQSRVLGRRRVVFIVRGRNLQDREWIRSLHSVRCRDVLCECRSDNTMLVVRWRNLHRDRGLFHLQEL